MESWVMTSEQQTPRKQESQVQVPSSSPIIIHSSPDKHPTIRQPSLVNKMDEKERRIEERRQKVRDHPDFPLIKKRFYYIPESDILKAFYRGKFKIREITKYLDDNYDKEEILRKEANEREKRIREEEELRKKNQQLRFQERVEQLEKKSKSPSVYDNDDEDESPVKLTKGKAKVKIDNDEMSPVKKRENQASTKVTVTSNKSITQKFNRQPTIDSAFRLDSLTSSLKRRKLTRFGDNNSNANSSTASSRSVSPVPVPPPASLSKFSYTAPSRFEPPSNAEVIALSDEEDEEDELEKLERKISENRNKNKNKKGGKKIEVVELSDVEDDFDSDSLDEADDDNVYGGYTSIDGKILDFINSATLDDLTDICGIEPKIAEVVISQKPFANLDVIANNDFPVPDESGTKSKNNSRRKKIGLKMIENAETNLKGYKAIDSLVKKCSEYSEMITTRMKDWGVTVTGEDGELDIVDIDPVEEVGDQHEDIDHDEDEIVITKTRQVGALKYIKHKPLLLADDITLNNYQQVGINWLNLQYQNKLSCILADEMGLGKTCQVIAFMAHLKQIGESGPHLVVVPASTLENWLREFNKFSPDLVVRAYYGNLKEREELRYQLDDDEFDVLVTTYSLACGNANDSKFLRRLNSNIIVYDEGHLLKNSASDRYTKLMRFKGNFRLILTGTPLQNNLKELVSLLSFMLPDLFNEKKEELASIFNQRSGSVTKKEDYNPLIAQQAIKNARTMMTPFVLRRRKDQVLQHLPSKFHEIVHCKLSPSQSKIYFDALTNGRKVKLERERRKTLPPNEVSKLPSIPTSSNVLMELRKAALHPLLFRVHYTDKILKDMSKAVMMEPEYVEANQTYIYEDMTVMTDFELDRLCRKFPKTLENWILDSDKYLDAGKINQLDKIITSVTKKSEKLLIFSMFTQMLDILEQVLSVWNIKYVRLDGGTKVEERQDTMDIFNNDDTIPVFLLSTKAGGFGINLVSANNVVLYDQSFNPHDDKQAEDRAHRVGQTKEVNVFKLISDETIEENMLSLAANKLELDESISILEQQL
ncbi:hypothetical protein G210_4888 [Candida maltosa Xu316]|uniref:DNA helicase n=1 Tax=Candida maltosa (strain Xu316) TaxID=1245528 RepID=M3HRH3_CANMX|nr:hypothetical protein G210_4888 [Candida maltosa Xu316]